MSTISHISVTHFWQSRQRCGCSKKDELHGLHFSLIIETRYDRPLLNYPLSTLQGGCPEDPKTGHWAGYEAAAA